MRGGITLNKCQKCADERERKAEIWRKKSELRISEFERFSEMQMKKLDFLISLSPKKFEDVVAEMFSRLEYIVKQTPYIGDQGKDAIVLKDDMKYVVECKRFAKGKSVGRPLFQKLYAAMTEENAQGAFFVTTGNCSKPAVEYSKKYNITIIQADELAQMMGKVFPSDND